MIRKGCLVVVSGPSGTGKGTVCGGLLKARPTMFYSISATTRPPRQGETNGVEYFFRTRQEFETLIKNGGLLEYAEVYGNYYGTPRSAVEEKLEQGSDVLLEIDTQGALNVMKSYPDGVYVFLLPPSMAELERRLRSRETDAEEVIRRRLDAVRDEIAAANKYSYLVTNDAVDDAVSRICAIIEAEHARTPRNREVLRALLATG